MNIETLKGQILSDIEVIGNEEIIFITDNGLRYRLYHEQICCETVGIAEIHGDLKDLIGSELVCVECRESNRETDYGSSSTWTFYVFSTIKGYVTIRWVGESNGYYSESVDFEQITE